MIRKYLVVVLLAAAAASAQQVPSSTQGGSAPPQLLTLDDVIREVQASNPAIAGSQRLIEAQQRRVVTAGALPDPTLTVAYAGSAVPFKTIEMDPMSNRGVSVMQMLPLAGKRELRREMARKEVSASEADRAAVVRRLVSDAKAAYFEYWYQTRALEITARNKARLQQLAEISGARYKVGKAMQQDVLRAQVELSMLLQRSIMLEQQRETAVARLNTLMGRPSGAVLPPPADVTPPSLPPVPALLAAAQENDPMLQRELAMVERGKVAVAMAKKEYVPDLSVGYMYQRSAMGTNMYGLQVGVNLPIFYRSKQREGVEQAKLELQAFEQSRESRKLELAYELKQMHAMAVTARNMLDLYENAIIPQAELALQSAQASYTVGSADFLTVVTNFSTIHSYQTDYYRQVADVHTALARIEALTGDLTQIGREAKQ